MLSLVDLSRAITKYEMIQSNWDEDAWGKANYYYGFIVAYLMSVNVIKSLDDLPRKEIVYKTLFFYKRTRLEEERECVLRLAKELITSDKHGS